MCGKKRLGAAILWLFLLLQGRTVSADTIDDFIQGELASEKAPGIALLVMQNGRIVKQKGYGYSNLELRVPVTPDTLFQSGSVGKIFTATGILLLAQDGKLRLDDRLAMYYPHAPAAWHRLTIRELLTHTSGIKDYAEYNSGDLDYRKDYTDDELLAVMQKLPLEFEPGTQWSYSNSGYLILGLLITKVAGKHWSEFLAERLFEPLGMQTAQVISESKITSNRAAGYQLDNHGALVNQEWVAPSMNRLGDGALYFSLRDLAAWEKALEARSFMSGQNFTDWWTALRLVDGTRHPYGLGWGLSEQRGQPLIFGSGGWQGFSAAIVRYPAQGLAVAVLVNAAQGGAPEIAREVAGLADRRLELRKPSGLQRPADAALATSLRNVAEAWGSYRVAPAMSPALAAVATGSVIEAERRRRVASVLRATRSLRVIGSDRLSRAAMELLDDGTVMSVDAVLETDDGPVLARFRIDSKGKVVRFYM